MPTGGTTAGATDSGRDRITAPHVWVLAGDKAGDNAQLRVVADALGWPWEIRPITANRFYRVPNWLLGGHLWSIDRRRSAALAPPWPDLVLSSGRRTVPVARWIARQTARQTGHRAVLVHLGRPWAPFHWFDLIIGMPQYGLPDAANLVHATLPLNRIPPALLTAGAAAQGDRLARLPRPLTTALIGGPGRNARLDAETAAVLGRALSDHVAARGGSLLVSTSRRTPAAVVTALRRAITVPGEIYAFQPHDPENPHFGFVAAAQDLVVTSDSASMIAEACRAGKPVSIAVLPTLEQRAPALLKRLTSLLPLPVRDDLLRRGLLIGQRDVAGLAELLVRRGAVGILGGPSGPAQPVADDLPAVLARIRGLFDDRPA